MTELENVETGRLHLRGAGKGSTTVTVGGVFLVAAPPLCHGALRYFTLSTPVSTSGRGYYKVSWLHQPIKIVTVYCQIKELQRVAQLEEGGTGETTRHKGPVSSLRERGQTEFPFLLSPGSSVPQPPRRAASEPLWKGPPRPRAPSPGRFSLLTARGASCPLERVDLSLGVFGQWDEKQERCPGRTVNERGVAGRGEGAGGLQEDPDSPATCSAEGAPRSRMGRCGPRVGRGEGSGAAWRARRPSRRDRLHRAPRRGEPVLQPGRGANLRPPARLGGGAARGASALTSSSAGTQPQSPPEAPPYPPKAQPNSEPREEAAGCRRRGARAGGPGEVRGRAGGSRGRAAPPARPAGAHTYPRARGSRLRRPSRRAPLAARCAPGPAGARGEGAGSGARRRRRRRRGLWRAPRAGGRPPRLRRQGENRAGAGAAAAAARGSAEPRAQRARPGAAAGCAPGRLRAPAGGAPVPPDRGRRRPRPLPPAAPPPPSFPRPRALARSLRASLSPLNAHSGWEKKTTCSQVAINFRGGRSPGGGGTGGRARRLWSPTPARPPPPPAPQPDDPNFTAGPARGAPRGGRPATGVPEVLLPRAAGPGGAARGRGGEGAPGPGPRGAHSPSLGVWTRAHTCPDRLRLNERLRARRGTPFGKRKGDSGGAPGARGDPLCAPRSRLGRAAPGGEREGPVGRPRASGSASVPARAPAGGGEGGAGSLRQLLQPEPPGAGVLHLEPGVGKRRRLACRALAGGRQVGPDRLPGRTRAGRGVGLGAAGRAALSGSRDRTGTACGPRRVSPRGPGPGAEAFAGRSAAQAPGPAGRGFAQPRGKGRAGRRLLRAVTGACWNPGDPLGWRPGRPQKPRRGARGSC
ncbi:collagen alpha-1(I) chain-like [Capricornis sumatraensis]|uniref:collagen alpha-1(I) chain-like n=1 Tax=Capricornis sumatraensis TaxID=34865 RepID=UPI00360487DA